MQCTRISLDIARLFQSQNEPERRFPIPITWSSMHRWLRFIDFDTTNQIFDFIRWFFVLVYSPFAFDVVFLLIFRNVVNAKTHPCQHWIIAHCECACARSEKPKQCDVVVIIVHAERIQRRAPKHTHTNTHPLACQWRKWEVRTHTNERHLEMNMFVRAFYASRWRC